MDIAARTLSRSTLCLDASELLAVSQHEVHVSIECHKGTHQATAVSWEEEKEGRVGWLLVVSSDNCGLLCA